MKSKEEKSVLISIQPKWVEKIASGEKTIEVRKTAPKLQTPFKCYIYCTKDRKDMFWVDEEIKDIDGLPKGLRAYNSRLGNCSIVGEFVCDRIAGEGETIRGNACLTVEELQDYCNGKNIYFWHISNLKIYDKPKELSEFMPIPCRNNFDGECVYKMDCKYQRKTFKWGYEAYECERRITRPPQSWCYVEELK